MYDRNGAKMIDKEGGMAMEDAAGFFANVFGGERFRDYVRPPAPILPTRASRPPSRSARSRS